MTAPATAAPLASGPDPAATAPGPGAGPLYVYAILPEGALPPLAAAGLLAEAGPPGLLACGAGLAALAGPAPEGAIARTRRNLLAHTRVIEEAMAHAPLLPVRFGVVAPEPGPLAARIRARAPHLHGLLARFAGRIEVGLRLAWDRPAALAALAAARPDLAARRSALPATGEAAYRARIALGREIAEAVDAARGRAQKALLARLLPLAEDHVLKPPEEDVEVLRADFLLPRAAEPAFAAAVEALAAESALPLAVRYVAPAPIYNFVSLSLDGPEAG